MTLRAGLRVGPYEIVGVLGAGGMGEVYRARDTKLNRDVAIKVLLPSLATDAARLDRLSREAQLLASLNHTNIAQIFGIEDSAAGLALVMELVEGPTLADRIAQGAIPVEDALPIAKQIADALETAHEQGIIHRDLKPANVKVRTDGTVKVLDFGLAKALDPSGSALSAADSPTLSMQATAAGVILGTAAYMAPEQARGKAADKRADVWAFGCVLFEMLAGVRAFGGDDVTDTMVAVISKEPDWQALPPAAAPLRPLLLRCLKKDRRQRLQSIGDARIQVEELIVGPSVDAIAAHTLPTPFTPRTSRPIAVLAMVAGAAIGAAAMWALARQTAPILSMPARFEIVSPAAHELAPGSDRDIAIAPDGRRIVYRTRAGELVVRAIDRTAAEPLAGITNARQPFFSPDSQWIGYFDNTSLKRVSIAGGAAITICQTPIIRGASWGDDNTIVFSTTDTTRGLLRVPASGGEPAVLTTPDAAKGEVNHWYPSLLPDGRGVLFTITARNAAATARVAVVDLKTGRHKTLTRGSQAEYIKSGHLVYVADRTLHAVRFDLERLEIVGDPLPLIDGVWTAGGGAANYGVSRDGTLVYVPPGTDPVRSLVWVDRKGKETPFALPPRAYDEPRLSPDGLSAAITIRDQEIDIHILDLAQPSLRRLTFGPGIDASPVWTSDGQRIVFGSQGGSANVSNLFTQAVDGTGTVQRLTTGPNWQNPSFIARDGTGIIGFENAPMTASDIIWFPLANPIGTTSESNGSLPQPIVQTPFIEINPEISPDGRYMAYQSNESGRYEVYVRPFPRVSEGRWQASSGGGTTPAWARNGRELFYLDSENKLTAVPVKASASTFSVGNPLKVLDTAYAMSTETSRNYEVSPDGTRFMMIKENIAGAPARAGMIVVLNWFEELKARLAAK